MALHDFRLQVVLALSVFAFASCSVEKGNKRRGALKSGAVESGDVQITVSNPGEEGVIAEGVTGYSLKSRVRFKKQQLLRADLEQSLGLPAGEICKEFSELDCIDEVHKLALGGVDAYHNSIFVGIEEGMPTTPIVLERIVLAGCGRRVDEDFASLGSALVFRGLRLESSGNLVAGGEDRLGESVEELYKRALKRRPSAEESAALVGLYESVAQAVSRDAVRSWAELACYAVHTSVEFTFY